MAKISLRLYHREIETLIEQGELEAAIVHCRHILQTFPKCLDTYRLLGKAYLQAMRHEEAMDIFRRLLMALPYDFTAHVGMALIYDDRGKLDEALWHMSRAFDVQPANRAVQAELQRLYNQRDGITPSRIRLTRAALAHLYLRGQLYLEAIEEIHAILKEEPSRYDMQTLLAKALFFGGYRKEAAELCSQLLETYPYNFEANRVLAELSTSTSQKETTEIYRRRLVEMDPYINFATRSVFLASQVPDASINIEHYEWKPGVGVEIPSGWEGLALGEETVAEGFSPSTTSEPDREIQPAMAESPIPDWLRQAGWGEASGEFVERPLREQEEPPAEKAELPDWLKALAPPEILSEAPTAAQPEAAQPAEELPDWLKGIAAEAPTAAKPEAAQPAEELPDWLKGIAAKAPTAAQPAQPAEELPDWLKGIVEEAPAAAIEGFAPPPVEGRKEEPASQEAETPGTEELPEWIAGEETPPEIPPPTLEWQPAVAEPPAPSITVPPHPKRTGSLSPTRDLHLAQAQMALERGDIRQAVEHYARLIRKGRLLDEVIFDLREALYRYPVDVLLWQTLGDAYMRANRLREALDAYTKAEQLLR